MVVMDFPWQNKNGKWENASEKFKVPCDVTDPPSRTRQQKEIRQSLVIVPPPITETLTSTTIKTIRPTYRYCSFWNCSNKGTKYKYKCIPPIPRISLLSKSRNVDLMKHVIKTNYRINLMYCCGLDYNDKRKDIRICSDHEIEEVEKEINWIDNNQQNKTVLTTMYLPKVVTGNITPSQQHRNGGVGLDRWMNRQVDYVIQNMSQEVAQTVGLLPTSAENNFTFVIDKTKTEVSNNDSRQNAIIRFSDLSNSMVKERTGFQSVFSMLSFVVVLCEGQFEILKQSKSKVTWLEEWFLYFEVIWGKSASRWVDVSRCYRLSIRSVRRIFDDKINKHIELINKWPTFVDYDEDKRLRKESWNEYYGERRIIMWDNTSLPMYKPSLSSAQRNTYSAYYAGNVAKGGVFIQPSGWVGTNELWVGAVSDTDYMERSGAYKQQQTYLDEYDTVHNNKQWTIIFDKGYRVGSSSWLDEQNCEVLQPTFARSDVQFTDYETLRSAAIASDPSANERAVCWCKRCDFLLVGYYLTNAPSDSVMYGSLGDFNPTSCTNLYFSC